MQHHNDGILLRSLQLIARRLTPRLQNPEPQDVVAPGVSWRHDMDVAMRGARNIPLPRARKLLHVQAILAPGQLIAFRKQLHDRRSSRPFRFGLEPDPTDT